MSEFSPEENARVTAAFDQFAAALSDLAEDTTVGKPMIVVARVNEAGLAVFNDGIAGEDVASVLREVADHIDEVPPEVSIGS